MSPGNNSSGIPVLGGRVSKINYSSLTQISLKALQCVIGIAIMGLWKLRNSAIDFLFRLGILYRCLGVIGTPGTVVLVAFLLAQEAPGAQRRL